MSIREFNDAPKTPPPEFSREEKTPAGVILTARERSIVIVAIRAFIKPVVPALPKIAALAGPAFVALILAVLHAHSGQADAEKKAKVGYGTLVPASNKQAEEIAELKKAVAQLADSVALQARLALASRPGFDDKGKPEAAPAPSTKKRRARPVAPPADPTIVKKVAADAEKNQALKAALVAQKPAPAPLPTELPAEVPKPPTPPAQKPTGQEWPPPVPVQPPEATP